MRLIREVWPDPDPDLLSEIRRSPVRLGGLWFEVGGASVTRTPLGRAMVAWGGWLILTEGGCSGCWSWPELGSDIDVAWKTASMLTAFRHGVDEEPLLPVAYKALESGGVSAPNGRVWTLPRRFMGPARCAKGRHSAPVLECTCGFHAAFSVVELTRCYSRLVGVLVVTPVGRTIWHSNAWRAAGYQVHAAVVDLEWVPPDGWDEEIPVVRARRQLIPFRAYQVAREVRAMLAMEEVEA